MPQAKIAEAPKTRTRRPPKRKQNEELIRRFFDGVSRRDLHAMAECWSDEVVEDVVPTRVFRGKREVRDNFGRLFAAVPDLETTVSRVVADERHAVVEWRMRGTFDGASFEGIEPTGRPVELRGVDLFEIEEGAVKASSVYYDGMAFARGAGMLPPPDSGTERAIKGAFNAITKVRRAVNERTGS
jgi:steroid delta-isomerase-like uncharacterized protein